jgi:AraC-like DNA-binding protein
LKDIDLSYICTVLGNLSGIPIRVFRGGELVFYHSLVKLPEDPMKVCARELMAIGESVGYYVTPDFYYFGVVNSGEIKLVAGPASQVGGGERELRELAFRADVPQERVGEFISAMRAIVPMPLESIIQMLCAVNFMLSGERLELKDVTIYDSEQRELRGAIERQQFNARLAGSMAEAHNTMDVERELLQIVQRGDVEALAAWAATAPAVRGGVIAYDQLRQLKNTFIVACTLASRAAITGGMTADEALALSDSYIRKCELQNSAERISNLQFHMVEDYTRRVARLRGSRTTELTLKVANYVQRHLCERISVNALAKELYLSRPYLSERFKAESGESLTDYILREKTTEARRLLDYTDKSLTSISSYLSFSSPSHFSRVFKKYTGMLPSEYRGR